MDSDNKNLQPDVQEEESCNGVSFCRGKIARRLICALVVIAVLLINVAFGILIYNKVAYIDLTMPKYDDMLGFYTLSDGFKSILSDKVIPAIDSVNAERAQNGKDKLKLKIIFCQDKDKLDTHEYLGLVHYTARQLESMYPDYIETEYTSVRKNPSSVSQYKITGATVIYPTDVIFVFGTEFNIHGQMSFYTQDTDTGELWAYNGEKKFCATMLSLTLEDSPVCALTTNHGEGLFDYSSGQAVIRPEYSIFINVIEAAGYRVELLDLEKDEIPRGCRMMICFAPTKDLVGFNSQGYTGVSEVEKLDKYLDASNSLFYICDKDTPRLRNMEEYLAEWGIAPSRETTGSGLEENYKLFDTKNGIVEDGSFFKGRYETQGLGASVNSDILALPYPPAVIFGECGVIGASDSYDKEIIYSGENQSKRSVIYSYYNNGIYRTRYDVFTSCADAFAKAGGNVRYANESNLFSIFTLTEEPRQVQEDAFGMVNLSSYVIALSSTQFLTNEFLDSPSYKNTDTLLAVLRATGRETVPVNLNFKAFGETEIGAAAFGGVNKALTTSMLCIAPVVILLSIGMVVCVKRKYL